MPTLPSPPQGWSSSRAEAATRMQDIAGGSRSLFSPENEAGGGPAALGGHSQPNRALARTCRRGRARAAVPRAGVCLGSPNLHVLLSRRQAPRGNSWMSKTRSGSGAGIWLGTWQLPGVGVGPCPRTAFLPRCRQAGLSHQQPGSGAVPAQQAQARVGGGQCHLLRNTPPLVFHPAKPGRIGSHPVSSHPTPPQPPISLSCSQPGEQPQFVLHQKQLWPGQLRLGWG